MATSTGRRRWLLVGVAAIAIASAAIGWVAGRQLSSPDDLEDQIAAPEASLITVPVELRELATTVTIRGDVVLEGSQDVEIDASAGAETGGVAVVTGTPVREDDLIDEGMVLLEVSERPIIALQGELPMFRSLGPGSRGDDVEQLEAALERLGFQPGKVDAVYNQSTETAVESLYVQAGYTAPGLTDEEQLLLDQARAAVDDARRTLSSAQASLQQARQPVPESQRLAAARARDAATEAVEIAEATAKEMQAVAEADVAEAIARRADARADRDLAQERLSEADEGTHPDTGKPPTDAELEELRAALDAAEIDLAAARAEVDAARATRTRVAQEQDALIADAKANLAIARAQYNELLTPPSTTFETQAVADARGRLDDAEDALAEVEAETGVRLPRAEIVFLDVLPRRVQRLNVARGDIVGGVVMTVSGVDVTIESAVSAGDRPLVKVGDVATVDDESLGISFQAEIVTVADSPGGRVTESRYYLELRPVGEVESDIAGLNLRISIPITTTGGEVMTVPLAALSAGADGSVRVEVESDVTPGETRIVTVATGLETTGFVEITAVEGELAPGDRVVVGR